MGEMILPTAEQLVVCSQVELKGFFGQDVVVPRPPEELFLDLEKVIKFGARDAKPYYQRGFTFTERTELDGWQVKPWEWFWKQIRAGNISAEAATLEEGWFIDLDPQGVLDAKDDYLAPIMRKLRGSGEIEKMQKLERVIRLQIMRQLAEEGKIYQYPGDAVVSENSRCGVSPEEIEKIILPHFTQVSQVVGSVGIRKFIEYNVRGRIGSSEYFADKFSVKDKLGNIIDRLNLIGGNPHDGGLSFVYRPWAERSAGVGFSLIIAYPHLD